MRSVRSGRAEYADVTGDVLFGNAPLSRDLLSFVPQFDDLNGARR